MKLFTLICLCLCAVAANPCTMPNCTCDCHAATQPTTAPVTTIHVGSAYPIKTLAQAIPLANIGKVRIAIDPGTYDSAPVTITGSNVTIEPADPNNWPTIKFTLPKYGSGITFTNGTTDNTVRKIVFDVPNGETYAMRPRGTNLTLEDITVAGQGGVFLTDPADVSRNLRVIRPKTVGPPHNHYAIYLGGDEQDVLIQDCDFVPSLWSASLRVMRAHNVTIKGGHIRQDATTGMRTQAVQIRGHDGLYIDGLTIDSMNGGALDIGCLPWQQPGNSLPNCAVRNSTINGYVLVESGANAQLVNNTIKAAGNGGYVIGLKSPDAGVTRASGRATISGNTITGEKLASGSDRLTVLAGNTFNLKPLAPTSQPSTQP
jgi:hypothetical protein